MKSTCALRTAQWGQPDGVTQAASRQGQQAAETIAQRLLQTAAQAMWAEMPTLLAQAPRAVTFHLPPQFLMLVLSAVQTALPQVGLRGTHQGM